MISKAVVTGASGLLGGNIVRELLAAGSEVIAVVRDVERARRLLPPEARLVRGDVTDVAGFAAEFAGADAILHTAAYFREYYQPGHDPALLRRTNVDSIGLLLQAAADTGVSAVVHISSIGALGAAPASRPADESRPLDLSVTRNRYYLSKIASEQLVAEFAERRGLRVSIVLPGWMWGPGDAGPTSAGRLFLAVAGGELPAVPDAGNHVVDARDVAVACVRAADGGSGRYVVAGPRRTLPEICAGIAREVGVRTPRAVPPRVALSAAGLLELRDRLRGRTPTATRQGVRALMEGNKRHVSSARATDELGITFRDLERTLPDTAAWYRDHGMLPA
ncbi:MAG: NAD-dependent epimerase/dehydratase family protein [Pseudonocardiaceae bacterium]